MPFERNPYFTGRESELARIEGMLFAEDQTSKIAVSGLGGVGKTSLVIEFVHRTRGKHTDCSIFWIPATTMESVQHFFPTLSRQSSQPCKQVHQPHKYAHNRPRIFPPMTGHPCSSGIQGGRLGHWM
jgi:hypothetical protein